MIDQRVFELYDEYCHGRVDRRVPDARERPGGRRAGDGAGAAPEVRPGNSGTMRGYLVQPAGQGPFPAVLVIHENRGLNPYIEDVARRAAVEGFLALARHAEQRPAPEGAQALERQARRHGLLLGRRNGELPGYGARPRSTCGSALLWRRSGYGERGAYEMHIYPGTQHGFHNNSTPRYNEAAAKLAWARTIAFLRKHLA